MEGAYGVVVAPEGEVDLVLEQQVLDIGPELARNGLIGSVPGVAVLDASSPPPSPPSPPPPNRLSHGRRNDIGRPRGKTGPYPCESMYMGRWPEKTTQGVLTRSTFFRSSSSHFHCTLPECACDICTSTL